MDPVTSLSNGFASQGADAANGFSDLSSEEFVKIIFTELSKQDPLKPNDSSALLEQMSSLRSIQSDIDLSRKLESMVTQNQLASAGNMIGKYVSGYTAGFERTEGYVISISRTSEGPVLNLDTGLRIPFDNVDEMIDPSIFGPPPTQPTPTPTPAPTPPPTT